MQTLFIGQSYIDVTFLTDHMPVGDEKRVDTLLRTKEVE